MHVQLNSQPPNFTFTLQFTIYQQSKTEINQTEPSVCQTSQPSVSVALALASVPWCDDDLDLERSEKVQCSMQ